MMKLSSRALTAGIRTFVWLLFFSSFSYGSENDISCLRSIKDSLEDPQDILLSWDFNNNTEGFICRFIGVDCWHPDENRVLNIRLSDMGLEGEFPRGVINCTSMTGLDLSSNKLYGSIPSDISNLLPFVTSLDLSSNNISGEIPLNLSNCSYLNILRLDNNQLRGQIPAEFVLLRRMKTFTVANNHLTGPVPRFPNATQVNYANNTGLCGSSSLPACQPPSKRDVGLKRYLFKRNAFQQCS